MTIYRQHAIAVALLVAASGFSIAQTAPAAAPVSTPVTNTQAQPQAGAQTVGTATTPSAYSGEGDSIDQRAKRAKALEDAKLAAEFNKANPVQAGVQIGMMGGTQASTTRPVMRTVPRAEFYVEAIRGFDDQLEAALVINHKRVTGSKLYPTLTDGWSVNSVTVNGVVITKGKERQSLAFVGPEPYQTATTSSINPAIALPAAGGGAMPPGMPMPVGAIGR